MSEPSSRAERSLVSSALTGVLALCVAAALVVFAVYGLAMVAFPHQVDYGEGVVLQQTDALVRGEALYRDPAVYPWRADPYAPLYVAACAALSPWLGVTLAAGRLVSWLAALGALVCLAAAARRRGGALGAVAGAAFFICSPLTVNWAAMYRVDFLGLFFETAGLLVIDRALGRHEDGVEIGRGPLAAGAVLFALAFFTKQTFVLGAIAACAAVGMVERRRGVELAGLIAALVAVPFAALEWASGGRFFTSLFSNNVMPWSWERAWPWVSQYMQATVIPLGLAIAAGFSSRWRPRVWWIYLALSALTLVGVGRVGAYYNHFLPFHAALSVVAGVGVSRLMARPGLGVAIVAGLAALQVAGIGFFCELKPTLVPLYKLGKQVMRAADGRLQAQIGQARDDQRRDIETLARYPGDVVAENMALPVIAGRPTALCDPSTLFAMAEAGRWDEGAFIESVKAHRFGVIILQRTGSDNLRFSPRAIGAINDAYVEAARVGAEDHVLVPRR